jgi:hypothetical protein
MAGFSTADVETRAQQLAKLAGEVWQPEDSKPAAGQLLNDAGRDHYRTLARKQMERAGDA